LRALDQQNRVIYVAQFSKVFAPGLRLGFLVAAPEFIREARELRRLSIRHPPLNNQRTAAYFLALGHYDALMMRLGQVFDERRTALRDALNHYLQQSIAITPVSGGTAFWVRGPDELDVGFLAREAARRGILIEPLEHYFAGAEQPQSCFRMGITGVPLEKIRPAIESLAMLIRDLMSGRCERLDTAVGEHLEAEALQAAMSGATILCRTVYGDPCTIELLEDGRMRGRAGYANEDCDLGRWWVDGARWNRQWEQWAYGEPTAFFVVIEGERIKWFDASQRQVDSAIIQRRA
jgi:GntR family transcriptional regulator/MocR family aminotransferase